MSAKSLEGLVALVLALFALMAGFFYAFTVAVMPGLDTGEAPTAIRSMQSINLAVRNPAFFVTYFLTPVIAVIVALVLWSSARKQAARLLGIAALVYIAGVLLPTGAVNVPMNQALALVTVIADGEPARAVWTAYSGPWTLWNTARTGFCLLSVLAAGMSLARVHVAEARP